MTWDKMGLFASIVIYPQNIVYELAQNETVRHFPGHFHVPADDVQGNLLVRMIRNGRPGNK